MLAGLASPAQAQSALGYIDRVMSAPDGDTITDSNVWDRDGWGDDGEDRVEPFIGYYEVLARFATARTNPRST